MSRKRSTSTILVVGGCASDIRLPALPRQQSSEQNFVHSAAEAFLAVDDDDGDAGGVTLAKLGVGVDVDELRLETVLAQEGFGLFAEVTAGAGVEEDGRHGRGGRRRWSGDRRQETGS
jgi:hypothetical protein